MGRPAGLPIYIEAKRGLQYLSFLCVKLTGLFYQEEITNKFTSKDISCVMILVSAMLFAVNGISNAQSSLRSNIEVFDKEISKEIDRILYKPDLRKDVQFIFSISSKNNKEDEIRFLNSVLRKTAESNKIWVSITKGKINSKDTVSNSVYIEINELKTKYPGFETNTFLGSKFVHRNLLANISVLIYGNKYDFRDSDTISVNYKDRVDLDEIDNIETEVYRFTKGIRPRVSTFEEIVFPAAIIIISVAATILFFTIRSK